MYEYIIIVILCIVLLININNNSSNNNSNKKDKQIYTPIYPIYMEQLWNNPTRINYYSYDIRDYLCY